MRTYIRRVDLDIHNISLPALIPNPPAEPKENNKTPLTVTEKKVAAAITNLREIESAVRKLADDIEKGGGNLEQRLHRIHPDGKIELYVENHCVRVIIKNMVPTEHRAT